MAKGSKLTGIQVKVVHLEIKKVEEVTLPLNCPACDRSLLEREFREYGYSEYGTKCRADDKGELDYPDCTEYAGDYVTGYACVCGHVLAGTDG